MPKNIIGLDVGTHSIKAVEIRTGYRGFEVVNFSESPSSQGLRRVFSGGPGKAGVVTALSQASMRIISLPFRDERKIEQVVPFEIEPYIPFPLDEVVVAWHLLEERAAVPSSDGSTAPPDASDIIVAAAPKSALREFLGTLSTAGIDPRIVDYDPLVPVNLLPWMNAGESPVVVLDHGKSRSSLTIFSGGHLRFARGIAFGGEDITHAVAKSTGMSRDDAETEKIRCGMDEDDGPRKAIARSLEDLIHQISQTFIAAEETAGIKVGRILLSGGGARLKGLRDFLSERLQCEVGFLTINLPMPSALDPLVFARALGLALRASSPWKGASTINFRREEYAYHPPREEIAGRLRTAGILVGTGMFLGIASFAVSLAVKEVKMKKLTQEERQVFASVLPAVPYPPDALEEMRGFVARERMGGGTGSHERALDILREMSSRIPKEVKIDIQELTIDSSRIRMMGATDSLDGVDKIVTELKKSEDFSEVKVLDTRRSADGNAVNFQVSIALKGSAPEGAGGGEE